MLSLLMGMVCSVGWAQPTVSPAPSDGQWAEGTTWYQIKTGQGHYLRSDVLQDDAKLALTSTNAAADKAGLWCITGNETDGFTFYNYAKGPGAPLGMKGSEAGAYAELVQDATGYTVAFDFTESKKEGDWWCVKEHGSANNYWNNRNSRLAYWNSTDAVNGWDNSGSGDDGSALMFIEFKQPDVTTFSTEDAPRWYSVEFKTGGNFLTDAGSGNNMVTVGAADSNEECWMFIGDYFGFKMKSGNGNYVYYDETASRFRTTNDAAAATTLTFVPGAAADTWELQRSGSSKCMNQNGGTGVGVQLGEWTVGDANNPFYLNATVLSNVAPVFTDGSTDWFMIRFANGGNHLSSNGADGQAVTAAIRNVASQWWKFVGTAENFQLVSKDGRYATIKSGTATNGQTGNLLYLSDAEDASGFSIVETSNATYAGAYEIVWNGSTGNSFNQWGGANAGMSIGLWTKGSNGNPLYLYVPGEDLIATFDVEGISGYTPASPLTLWYTNAASNMNVSDQWMEYSLPIGNGQFGASIFGGVAREEVQFNEKTLWSGTKNDNSSEYGDYENFGSLYIDDISGVFGEGKAVKNYYRQLDLSNATASVHYTSTDGTINFTREYISSNPDEVVAMRLTADQAGQISIRVTMESGRPGVRATTSYAEGTAHFAGKLETVSYDALAKVVPTGGTMTTDANGITVTGADEVLIILGGATDFDAYNAEYVSGTANLSALVQDRVNDAAEKTWSTLYSTHLTDYKSFFDRCNFVLDGAANTMPTDDLVRQYQNRTTGTEDYALMLEQLYFAYGRYLEIGSSRGVDLPSNLQGIWNNSSEPAWNADIHSNINVQMNYWPAEPTNLSELHMPFLNYIINMAESDQWKSYATAAGQSRGWTCYTENNIFGGVGSFMHNYVIANAWYATHLWQHYRYTLDRDFLKKAFPAMWSASMFWMDRLVLNETDGTYECPNEYSPEHGPSENAVAHAQQLVWELFDNTLKAYDILGASNVSITESDLATLQDRFDNLDKGLAIEQYTANGESGAWGESAIAYGSDILREWKTSNYYAGTNGHRHMSHMMCLYPFSQVTPESPYFDAAVNSMKLRGDASTGWSMGWKINLWARAMDGDHSHDILELALRHHSISGGGVYYNLYDSHAPFQIDGNFGACAGIAEMLMQSHTDVIQILPALPSVWENGRITGLKAVGNFTVDIEWANNEAQTATIVSHAGTELRVSCNRGDIATAIITVDGVNTAVTVENGIATIPCTQGQTVVINFQHEALTQQTTAPEDGYYILYSESSSGKGWVYHDASLADRKYRVNTDIDLSAGVTSDQMRYVWKLTNNTSDGTFTLQNASTGVYMPADAVINKNMNGTETANLAISAVDGKEGFWYVYQTNYKNGNNLMYIHTNSPGGHPNLSYWDGYSADGSSIRASFYKVNGLEDVTYTFNYVDGEGNAVATATYSCLNTMEVTENVMREHCPEGYTVLSHTSSDRTYTIVVTNAILTSGASYYIYCDNDSRQYFYNNGGSLGVAEKRVHFSKNYLFTCTFDGQYYQFKNQAGKYLGFKGLSETAYNFELREYIVGEETRIALYAVAAGKYFVMKNDGSFDQAGDTYNAETTNFSTSYKFEEYTLPKDGETYYIYSDTYYDGAYVPRYLYAEGGDLKLSTATQSATAYQWTATVTDDGYVQFRNGDGKYLKHKGVADAAYNFTLSRENVHHNIAATLYSVADARYFVVKNDGTSFDQSTGTYNQEADAHCSDFVFIPVSEVKLLSVIAPSKVEGTATWNNETKALPASWMYLPGTTIDVPTLSVDLRDAYTLSDLKEGETSLGTSVSISELTDDRIITVEATPAFFSSAYGEKWVRLRNCSKANYWANVETAAENGNGKTATLDFTDEAQLWCLVGTADNFVLYNKAAGESLALNVPLTGSNEANVSGDPAVLSATKGTWKLIEQDFGYALVPTANPNTSNLGINMWAGDGGYLKIYATAASNTGSYWTVEMVDVDKPLTISVAVDKVWESSPRVAELTVELDGQTSTTRILGNVDAQTYYLPTDATFSLSSMTYRGYTFNGFGGTYEDATLPEGGLNVTASYTANDERTLFYTPGANGHPYRIPAIATAPNGDIFAICDFRPCRGDIGNGDVDIVCRISSDNGVTWGDEIVLANGDGGSTNRMETGYGDPAIVVDRESNKILVMMVAGRTVCGNSRWDASKIGVKDAEAVNRAARVYGTLNETTGEWEWTQPEEVTDDIYKLFLDESNNATVTSYFIGSGKICQSRVVKKGEYYRLYCSLWTRDNGNRVIYSDDFGGTWHVLGTINDRPAPNGNEPKCEELPDGTVVLSSRVAGGRYFNLFTFADDTYTTGTWGQVANSTTVRDGSNQGTNGEIYKVKAIRKEDGQICDVMLQSVPAGPARTNVTVWYKEMDYTTAYTPATFAADWNVGKQVSDTESAYSTMHLQTDGRIGFLMEEVPGGYCIVYIPYTLEDLTANKYTLYTVSSTISSHGIGTFYASEAMQIPEGVKAYAAVEIPVIDAETKIGTLSLNQLTGFIPAKTGAVLLGGADTYTFMPSISYGTAVEGNLLVGFEADDSSSDSYAAVTLPTDGSVDYVLSVKNDLAAFYRKAADFKVYNNKAYLQVPATTATALRLRFVDADGTTSIRDVMTEMGAADAVYDLQGRRVRQAGKGVYIVNGKKVLR